NNTNVNNTNINQSINNREEIKIEFLKQIDEMYDSKVMPISVLKQLSLNMDRLIDDNINPYEISIFFKSSDNTVNDNDFALLISNVLKKTKGQIGSFHAVMKKAIKNWYDEYDPNFIPNVSEDKSNDDFWNVR
ncbi:hypothetical protein, partial [Heyndrickxia sporothermodurans]